MPLDNAAANPQSVADAGNYQSSIDQAIKQTNAAPSPTPRPVARMTPTAQSYFQQAQQGIEEERQYRAAHPLRSAEQSLWQGKPPEFDAAQAFGSTASVMGILLGALTRAPLTASLNASAAAMTALRQNDLMKYKEAKDTWEKNTELAMNNAKAYNEQVLKGLELMKSDHAAGLSAIQTAAAINKDDVLMGIQNAESAQRMLIARQQATDAHAKSTIEITNALADRDRALSQAQNDHSDLFKPLPEGASEQEKKQRQQLQNAAYAEAAAQQRIAEKAATQRATLSAQKASDLNLRADAVFELKNGRPPIPGNKQDEMELANTRAELQRQGTASGQVATRVITDAGEIIRSLGNMMDLPVGTTTGFFGNVIPGTSVFSAPRDMLVQSLKSDDSRRYEQLFSGMMQTLSQLESGGLRGSANASAAFESLKIKPGDSALTAIASLARMRDIVDVALESGLTNPIFGEQQKDLLRKYQKTLYEKIPFTFKDIIEYENRANEQETFADFAKRSGLGKEPSPSGASDQKKSPTAQPSKVPTLQEFLKVAGPKNPNATESELRDYYQQTYGGR
jgi:hypothetical protein